jgi:hypothetical protein
MNVRLSGLVAFVLSVVAAVEDAGNFQRDIPRATWEPIFFRSINYLTRKIGWEPLRDKPVPADSLEIRIWVGFGLTPLEGFRLRRDGNQWSAQHVIDAAPETKSADIHPVVPKSGWTFLWSKLSELQLLTLPDESALPPAKDYFMDGESYVVEINRDNAYRTYEYGNPQARDLPKRQKGSELTIDTVSLV